MDLPVRPSAMAELQGASAVGQGKLYRAYDEMLAKRGVPSAQVLLTFFDMSARTHYLNARQTLHKLLDWRIVPVINENDTTTTDEITFGDNDFLAAQVAILLGADVLMLLTRHRRPLHGRPARPRGRRADPGGEAVRGARVARDRGVDVAARLGRDALEGGGGRDGDRGRHPRADPQRDPPRDDRGSARGRRRRARASIPQEGRVSSFKLWLKYAKPTPRPARDRRRRRAGAARARNEPAAGGGRRRARRLRGGRRRGGLPARTTGARSGRGSSTTPPPSCGGSRD